MVDYVAAIKRPFTDLNSLLIGVVLSVLGFFIVPLLLVYGYALKAVSNTLNNNAALPKWEGWGELIVKGILAIVIGIIYMIIPGIVMLLGIGPVLLALFSGSSQMMLAAIATGGVIVLAGLILALIAYLLLPLALVAYVKEGRFGAAFAFGAILKKLLTAKYLVSWVISVVYSFVVLAILGLVPFVGTMIAMYLATITSATIFAEAYRETP